MRVRRLFLGLLLLGLAGAAPAGTTLTVAVHGVRDDRGVVRVAICPKAQFLQMQCPWRGSAPARPGTVTVTIDGIPPGIYAAEAYHDETDEGRIHRSLLGIPREGIGFSRDAALHFGPPSFADAAFTLANEPSAIALTLRYYD